MQLVNHSELRHRILSSLKLAPADSVTSLAQRLEVLRPSVSRAVKSLEDAGFVTRSGRKITLSPSGQVELRGLDESLSAKVMKDAELVTRVFGQTFDAVKEFNALTKQFDDITRNIGAVASPGLRAFDGLASLSSLQIIEAVNNSGTMQVAKAMKNNPVLQLAKSVTSSVAWQAAETFKATAVIQATNLDLFKGWAVEVPSPISGLILENNSVLGTMLSDLEAFTKIGTTVDQVLGGLVNQTLWTTKVYDEYFVDAVKGMGKMPTLDDLKISVTLPTQSVASLVGTTRSIVEAEIGIPSEVEPFRLGQVRPPIYSKQYQVAKSRIEIYLEPLGRRFLNKWEGAWQTFHSESKDRHSQATHSGRELLMQVLDFLAPDHVFTKEELAKYNVKKPTRKMRIEYILKDHHSSTVELINNVAKTLDSMYDVLVGETHRRDGKDHLDDTIAGMLGVLEDLLIMLLSMRKNEY
jgi:DNA-binding transcriptional ArsR family regulator